MGNIGTIVLGKKERLAVKIQINFKSEDVLIYSIVSFALLYPIIVAVLIFYEDYKKKVHYKETMTPLINITLGKENCKKIYQMKDILEDSLNPRDIEQICYKTRDLQVKSSNFKFQLGKEKHKIIYTAVLQKNNEKSTLNIEAISQEDSLKIVSVKLN